MQTHTQHQDHHLQPDPRQRSNDTSFSGVQSLVHSVVRVTRRTSSVHYHRGALGRCSLKYRQEGDHVDVVADGRMCLVANPQCPQYSQSLCCSSSHYCKRTGVRLIRETEGGGGRTGPTLFGGFITSPLAHTTNVVLRKASGWETGWLKKLRCKRITLLNVGCYGNPNCYAPSIKTYVHSSYDQGVQL